MASLKPQKGRDPEKGNIGRQPSKKEQMPLQKNAIQKALERTDSPLTTTSTALEKDRNP